MCRKVRLTFKTSLLHFFSLISWHCGFPDSQKFMYCCFLFIPAYQTRPNKKSWPSNDFAPQQGHSMVPWRWTRCRGRVGWPTPTVQPEKQQSNWLTHKAKNLWFLWAYHRLKWTRSGGENDPSKCEGGNNSQLGKGGTKGWILERDDHFPFRATSSGSRHSFLAERIGIFA